jgi:putative chitobiose transport system permease protein
MEHVTPSNNYKPLLAWQLLTLPLLWLGLVFVWPTFEALRMSLLDYTHNLYTPTFVGLGNYQAVIASSEFQQALRNTLFLLILVMPGVVGVSTLMALAFSGQYPGVMLARTLVYLPVVVSMIVAGMLWKWLLSGEGLFNALLQQLGLSAIPWLTSTEWVMPAIALVIIWKASAYYMMMLITRLESIPKSLYEAARLDGANPLQQFYFITLPQLRGMLTLVMTICTLGTLKIFGEIYVLTGGGPLSASKTLIFFIYERAFQRLDLGMGTAAGIVFACIIVGITLLQHLLKHRESNQGGRA